MHTVPLVQQVPPETTLATSSLTEIQMTASQIWRNSQNSSRSIYSLEFRPTQTAIKTQHGKKVSAQQIYVKSRSTATPSSSCPGFPPSPCTPSLRCWTRPVRTHTNTKSTRPSCSCRGTCNCRRTPSGRGSLSGRRWPHTPARYGFNSRHSSDTHETRLD